MSNTNLDKIIKAENQSEAQDGMPKFEINTFPADTTLQGYVDMDKNKLLDIPEFQRKYVWDVKRASALIESFLLGLPVPGIFLYRKRGSHLHLIIDGHQRIQSIIKFFNGRFDDRIFKLKGINSRWNNLSFEELSEEDKATLRMTVLRATIIQQIEPKDNQSIYHIFERLNTGGINLNTMQIRMCVADGEMIKWLREINKNSDWRSLIKQPHEHKEFRDLELLLRLFALFENLEIYKKSMKGFLDNFISENKNPSQEWMKKRKDLFEKAVKMANTSENGLPLSGKLSLSLLDSILVALMQICSEEPNFNSPNFSRLNQSEEFSQIVKQRDNTTGEDVVKKRIHLAKQLLGS
ncbi:MAG: DUF262 domain-containing protein [Rickettsiales bacterium]|nr:DUF262 domain-containing protein [Rickettsiales bacterium]